MKRIVNLRPLLLIFVSLVVGIFCAVFSFLENSIFYFICAFLEVALIILIISLNFLNKFKKQIVSVLLIVLFGLIIGNGIGYVSYQTYNQRTILEDYHIVTAQVEEVTKISERYQILLKNVEIDGVEYDFRLSATLDNFSSDINLNDYVAFDAYFYTYELFSNGRLNSKVIKDKIYYNVFIEPSNFSRTNGVASLIQSIKAGSYKLLQNTMRTDNANFCYTLLFGERTVLDETVYDAYLNSGLAHVLSVSGLHVSILIGIFVVLLNRLKLNKKWQFLVVFCALLFYCALCNFEAPMVRSSLMGLCLLLSYVFGERADSLSSISLAGILILLFQPLYIFDAGFLLSFGSIFGILLLYKPISALLQKIYLPVFIADLIGVTLSAQILTLPIIAYFFNSIPLISTISNLLILPLFSLMFVLLFVFIFVGLILPIGFVFVVVEMLVNVVNSLIVLFGKFGTISVYNFGLIASVFYFALIFMLSNFVMATKNAKFLCSAVLILTILCFVLHDNTPIYYTLNSITTMKNVENSFLLTTNENEKILIGYGNGNEFDYYNVRYCLVEKKIKNLNSFVIFDYTDEMQENVAKLCTEFSVNRLILPNTLSNSTLFGLNNSLQFNGIVNLVDINLEFECNDVTFNTYIIGSTLKMIDVQMNNLNFSILRNRLTESQTVSVINNYTGSKTVFCENVYESYSTLLQNGFSFYCKTGTENNVGIYSTQNYNLFTIENSFGTI